MPAGIDLPRPDSLSPAGNTAEERHRAALHAASRAVDVADCRLLLDALGLLPPPAGRQNGDQP